MPDDHGVVAWDEPPPLTPRGTLIVLTGRGEDPSVYERLGRRLAADAYRVKITTGEDEAALRDQIGSITADPEVVAPVVLLGSDTGAARAVRIAAEGPVVRAVVLGGLLPATGSVGFDAFDDELAARTSCPAHRARLTADTSFERNALAVTLSPAEIEAPLADLAVPVLAVHGAADVIAPADEALDRYRTAADVTAYTIAGGVHDVFNDINHRVVAALVVLFLERLRAGQDLVRAVSAA